MQQQTRFPIKLIDSGGNFVTADAKS